LEPTLIIIGGGVAGLTAGCYARMDGYQTKILEMGEHPGGLCTSSIHKRIDKKEL